jgi:hypothetical protein
MANILGLPFDPWVKTQIETRQKSLGQLNISPKDYQHYTTKSPFLRLASSVNLTNNGPEGTKLKNSVLQKLIENGVPSELITGDSLAKNFILQGGSVGVDGEFNFEGLKYGLNNGELFNGSYGWGGVSERGFIPMPGITNADVTYYNNGALSKTTINIKCFSKAQFQLIDTLYLRPGYSLLLEFGHSQYLDKDGNLKTFENFLTTPMSLLLKGDTNQWDLYNAIQKSRKDYDGNYEAVYGMISKFNWQFNSDGSYDCQVQLTGMGTVIESLKVNITSPTSTPTSTTSTTEEDPFYRDRNKTIINSELFRINSLANSNVEGFQNYTLKDFRNETGLFDNVEFNNGVFVLKDTSSEDESCDPNYQVYIKYGAFLAFLQSRVFLYDKTNNTPILSFDMDFINPNDPTKDNLDNDENYILNIPGQISTNPKKCLIPPSKFEIKYNGSFIGFDKTDIDEKLSPLNFKKGKYLGRLANVLINVNFLYNVLSQSTVDEDGNISLLSFLNNINSGIIQSTGNINSFDVRLNEDQTKIKFVEDIPQNFVEASDVNKFGEKNYARFNVFGVQNNTGSFIRNINLTADLSNNFATMVAIGSQANSNQINGNATSFSNYNAGLEDRIIPTKYSSIENDSLTDDKPNKIQQLFNNIEREKMLYKDIYWYGSLSSDSISSFQSNMNTAINNALGIMTEGTQHSKPTIKAPFFLPFNLQLEMDGLSGMRLYEKFKITENVLPPSYEKDSVDIIVKGINHSIDTSAWITKLDTISGPSFKDLDGVVEIPSYDNPPTPEETTSSDEGVVEQEEQNQSQTTIERFGASTFPLSPNRIEAMKKSYEGVFGRDGETPPKVGLCARWTYNLALNYISYLRGGTLKNPQLKSGGNAKNNKLYHLNLQKLGYTKFTSRNLTKKRLEQIIKNPPATWGVGDVIVYYATDQPTSGRNTHYEYGHTQIYVNDINSNDGGIGWTADKKANYRDDFIYNSRKSNNWNLIVFRSPEK